MNISKLLNLPLFKSINQNSVDFSNFTNNKYYFTISIFP